MIRRKIEGHEDAVLCCHAIPGNLLVSGGEDARLCYTDLSSFNSVGRLRQSYGDAVTSVCSSPAQEHLLYASAGQAVLALDLRKSLGKEAICDTWAVNQDEINHTAVNRQGSWLAAADDSGEVQVINLQEPRDPSGRLAYKTLRRGHSNICSAVCFRPHRPWELLSGGLDSTVLRWDFNRLRAQQSWDFNAEAAAAGGQMFNPPMVHSVVVPDTDDRSLCRLMAVARGDGYISVYDVDSKISLPTKLTPKVSSSSSNGKSSRKGAVLTESTGGKSKARRSSGSRRSEQTVVAPSKAKAGAVPGTSDTSAVAQPPALTTPPATSAAAPAAATEAAGVAAGRVPVAPGRLCLLGREQGGHTAAVNCLAFACGSTWQRLLSAGNDGRLLMWDWQAAAEEQGSSTWPRAGAAAAEAGAAGPEEIRGRDAEREEAAEPGRGSSNSSVVREAEAAETDGPPAASRGRPAGQEAAGARTAVVADVKHGRKINWVCSCEPTGGYNVFVADVTRRMTAMALF
ncbi:hypothetical protein N2152v2_010133 [Parachlorella kessleri]